MDVETYRRYDGLGLAGLVRSGDATPAELLEVARGRARAVNPALGALCHWLDAHADERVAGALTGPYAGVPFLLKDLGMDLAGEPTSAGSRPLAGRPAAVTSTVVARWLDAGLVMFGKTTTPELGAKGVTEPALYGPARNPWDLTRTPGGSSGGSAAAVAAGIVPVAAGNDGGGSIRIPAACCGLVGLKPGRGLVPFGPVESEPSSGLATHGVLSRTVRDTAAMLDVIVGTEPMSAFAAAMPERALLAGLDEPPGRLRIGFAVETALRPDTHPEARAAVERAAGLLSDLGHHVEPVAMPHDEKQLAADFLTIWFSRAAQHLAWLCRETGCREEEFELDTRVMAGIGRTLRAPELMQAQENRKEHVAALADFHDRYDLLLTPTLGEPPIEVGRLATSPSLARLGDLVLRARGAPVLKLTGLVDRLAAQSLRWVPYTQLANITGRPAISLPLHRTAEGLPMGVQLLGRLGSEEVLLRLARQLEQAAPWDADWPEL